MPEMHLKQPGFTYNEINKELKNLCKQEIQIIFTKMNWIKLLFSMKWFMDILKT